MKNQRLASAVELRILPPHVAARLAVGDGGGWPRTRRSGMRLAVGRTRADAIRDLLNRNQKCLGVSAVGDVAFDALQNRRVEAERWPRYSHFLPPNREYLYPNVSFQTAETGAASTILHPSDNATLAEAASRLLTATRTPAPARCAGRTVIVSECALRTAWLAHDDLRPPAWLATTGETHNDECLHPDGGRRVRCPRPRQTRGAVPHQGTATATARQRGEEPWRRRSGRLGSGDWRRCPGRTRERGGDVLGLQPRQANRGRSAGRASADPRVAHRRERRDADIRRGAGQRCVLDDRIPGRQAVQPGRLHLCEARRRQGRRARPRAGRVGQEARGEAGGRLTPAKPRPRHRRPGHATVRRDDERHDLRQYRRDRPGRAPPPRASPRGGAAPWPRSSRSPGRTAVLKAVIQGGPVSAGEVADAVDAALAMV